MKRVKRGSAEQTNRAATLPPQTGGNRLLRWAVNFWVVFHFAAVIAAAGSVGPTSDLVLAGWRLFRPYLQLFYLESRLQLLCPSACPQHPAQLRGRARRRVHGQRPYPRSRDPAAPPLSSLSTLDRTHRRGSRRIATELVQVVRAAYLPQVRRNRVASRG